MDGMQTPAAEVKQESSPPGPIILWSITSLATHPPTARGQEATSPGAPGIPPPLDNLPRPPTSGRRPLPRCPISWGLRLPLPVIPPSRGASSRPQGRTHGLAGTHRPGCGAERGSIGGESLVWQRALNRPALLARPARPLAPEVTCTGRGKAGRCMGVRMCDVSPCCRSFASTWRSRLRTARPLVAREQVEAPSL